MQSPPARANPTARIWRTDIDPRRADEYERFARQRSLPMFESQRGFCGALLTATGSRRAVITIWRDAAAAAALDDSTSYRATVAEIERAGFLVGEQSLEVLEITGVAGISLSAVG